MGAQTRSAKAGEAARSVASNPYVRRLIEDAELRAICQEAFTTVAPSSVLKMLRDDTN